MTERIFPPLQSGDQIIGKLCAKCRFPFQVGSEIVVIPKLVGKADCGFLVEGILIHASCVEGVPKPQGSGANRETLVGNQDIPVRNSGKHSCPAPSVREERPPSNSDSHIESIPASELASQFGLSLLVPPDTPIRIPVVKE